MISLIFSMLILLVSSVVSSSSTSQKSPILWKLSTLGQQKLYPKNKSQKIQFLKNLKTLLIEQAQTIEYTEQWLQAEMEIQKLQNDVDRFILTNFVNIKFNTITRQISFSCKAHTAEEIAFHLKYKNLIVSNPEGDPASCRAQIEAMLSEWGNSTNDAIKTIIKYIILGAKLQKKTYARDTNISRMLTDFTNKFCKIKNPHIKRLIQVDSNPLKFYKELNAHFDSWFQTQLIKIEQKIFTERNDDSDNKLTKIRKKVCSEYTELKTKIDQLTKEIDNTLKSLTSKKNDFMQVHHQISKKNKIRQKAKSNRRKLHSPDIIMSNNNKDKNKKNYYKSNAIESQKSELNTSGSLLGSSSSSYTSNTNDIQQACNTQEFHAPSLNQDASIDTNDIVENDIIVEFFDKKNEAIIKLFKVAKPQNKYTTPDYTESIKQWLKDPNQAKEQLGYLQINDNKFKYRASAQIVHSFSSTVDDYLHTCSMKSNILNNQTEQQDIVITLPGSITQNKEETFGLFTYFINSKTGKWYHRNFVPRTNKELLEDYMQQGYYEVEFPELR